MLFRSCVASGDVLSEAVLVLLSLQYIRVMYIERDTALMLEESRLVRMRDNWVQALSLDVLQRMHPRRRIVLTKVESSCWLE